MRILVIADDEFFIRHLPDCQADLLISLGDLPDPVILAAAENCHCREILAVKGNHDSAAPFPEPIRDLHLKTQTFGGVRFGGFNGSWKYKPKGNYLFEQHEVEKLMAGFPSVDVFLAHNSPRGVHDRDDEVHIGFVGFTNFITRCQPKLFLHGHTHIAQDSVVGSTRVIGTFGHRFLELPDVG